MREVIEDAFSSASQLFNEKDIAIELQLPATLPVIVADRDRLVQVMLNLLSNAAKFCAPGEGRVRVGVTHDGATVRVDVEDNGIGISSEDQQIIFEKFRQVGDSLTQKPQGTGLGLPICREIVHHFGGRLWVTSEPGRGACFSFTLPAGSQAAASAADAEPVRAGIGQWLASQH